MVPRTRAIKQLTRSVRSLQSTLFSDPCNRYSLFPEWNEKVDSLMLGVESFFSRIQPRETLQMVPRPLNGTVWRIPSFPIWILKYEKLVPPCLSIASALATHVWRPTRVSFCYILTKTTRSVQIGTGNSVGGARKAIPSLQWVNRTYTCVLA